MKYSKQKCDQIMKGGRSSKNAQIKTKGLVLLSLIFLLTTFSFAQSRQAQIIFDGGLDLYKRGDYQSALGNFNNALELYRQTGDSAGEANSLFRLGQTYRRLNNINESYRNYMAAYQIFYRLGKKPEATFTSNNVASILRDVGQFKEAIETYEKFVIPHIGNYGGKKDIAKAYNGLGQSYLGVNDPTKALNHFQQSLRNWKLAKTGDYDQVRATYGSAIAHYQLGNKTAATGFGKEALRLSRTYNDPVFQVEVLESLAQVYDADGDKKTAVDYRLQAMNVYKRNRNRVAPDAYDTVANNLADLYYRTADLKTAEQIASAAQRQGVSGREFPAQASLAITLGEIYMMQGKFQPASREVQKGIRLAQEAERRDVEAYGYACLGEVYLYMSFFEGGNPQMATTAFQKALGFFKPGESPYVETKAISGLLVALANTGQTASGQQYIARITSTGMDQGNDVSTILGLESIAKYNSFQGQHEEAKKYFLKAFNIAEKRGNRIESIKILNNITRSFVIKQDYKTALENYEALAQAYRNLGNKYFETNATLQAGWMSLNLGNLEQAGKFALNAALTAGETGNAGFKAFQTFESNHILGKVNYNRQNYAVAETFFKDCLATAERWGNKPLQKHAWEDLAQTYTAMGEKGKAKDARKKADKII